MDAITEEEQDWSDVDSQTTNSRQDMSSFLHDDGNESGIFQNLDSGFDNSAGSISFNASLLRVDSSREGAGMFKSSKGKRDVVGSAEAPEKRKKR